MNPALQPHQQRVLWELYELHARLDKLTIFLFSPKGKEVGEDERVRLFCQAHAMRAYVAELQARVCEWLPCALRTYSDNSGGTSLQDVRLTREQRERAIGALRVMGSSYDRTDLFAFLGLEEPLVWRARQMWDAYSKAANGVTFDGKPLPPWDQLGDDRRACWVAAAGA